MRVILSICLLVVLCGAVSAADPGNRAPEKPAPAGTYHGGGLRGGDTIEDASPILTLPYFDSGTTCGYTNDYDSICPYDGSTAPDVAYSYAPAEDGTVSIDLCSSQYDTKVYVWEDKPWNTIACNDDAGCGYAGWQSRIESVTLSAGHSYYIVIDGYGTSCGTYLLKIQHFDPCVVECPPGGIDEGEAPCPDNPDDAFNGGCNGSGWSFIPPGPDGCASLCGTSCTFSFQGTDYRDTDWFSVVAEGGLVDVSCTAEFPLQFMLFHAPDCCNMSYDILTVPSCEVAKLQRSCEPGQEIWLWVGPSVYTGVPPGSGYRVDLCGIAGSEPTWGACCTPDGCRFLPEAGCTGFFQGAGVPCDPSPCITWGACCTSGGHCQDSGWPECRCNGGEWIPGVHCYPDNPCLSPVPVRQSSWGAIKAIYR